MSKKDSTQPSRTEIFNLFLSGEITFILSLKLFEELNLILIRPKFRHLVTSADLNKPLKSLESFAEWFEPTAVKPISRDPKDDFLVALGLESGADFLISGDDDLKALKNSEISIVSPAEFLRRIKKL